jgi:hypothetical protein
MGRYRTKAALTNCSPSNQPKDSWRQSALTCPQAGVWRKEIEPEPVWDWIQARCWSEVRGRTVSSEGVKFADTPQP